MIPEIFTDCTCVALPVTPLHPIRVVFLHLFMANPFILSPCYSVHGFIACLFTLSLPVLENTSLPLFELFACLLWAGFVCLALLHFSCTYVRFLSCQSVTTHTFDKDNPSHFLLIDSFSNPTHFTRLYISFGGAIKTLLSSHQRLFVKRLIRVGFIQHSKFTYPKSGRFLKWI